MKLAYSPNRGRPSAYFFDTLEKPCKDRFTSYVLLPLPQVMIRLACERQPCLGGYLEREKELLTEPEIAIKGIGCPDSARVSNNIGIILSLIKERLDQIFVQAQLKNNHHIWDG